MDDVARLPATERAVLFTETAARAGVSAIVVEKDFWVVWSLGQLYGLTGRPRLLFKGGTSLSKCFRLIERFSEDIDLGLHREDLGLGGEVAPSADMGSSRLKTARRLLQKGAQEFVAGTFEPKIRTAFAAALAEPFELRLEQSDSESVLSFQYPCALPPGEYGAGRYVRPVVNLEIGARSDHDPTREVEVSSMAAERFPAMFQQASARVVAQAPERTLLEKALILHSNTARNKVGVRSSRHAYDLAMMQRAGVMASVTRRLFEEVAQHKRVFGDDRLAGEAPRTGLRMVPDETGRKGLEKDYRDMEEMFYTPPPAFDEIVKALRVLEREIAALK
jgi:hypothetical protein